MPAAQVPGNRQPRNMRRQNKIPTTPAEKRRITYRRQFKPDASGLRKFSRQFTCRSNPMSSTAAPKLSPERIFTTLFAYQQTFALKAAVELDLFTAIGEGANEPASMAKRCQTSERGIRILADYITVQ